MTKRWYVIDATDNALSWDREKDQSEFFTSRKAAEHRAKELAEDAPHTMIFVCETIGYYVTETTPVKWVQSKP